MGFDKDGYWSPREILGYTDAKFMIILSDRGRGKTVALKNFMITQPGEFMALYRDSSDMAHAIQSWTDDLVRYKGFNAESFEFVGSEKDGFSLLYNGVVKGYFRYLSAVNHIKQEGFPDTLNFVWLDEFIPMVQKKLQGVKSEGDALRTIMKTIDHDSAHPRETRGYKPLRCFLVGNPHNWNNPLLSYFHVDAAVGYGVHRIGPGIVCEHIPPIEDLHVGGQTVDEFLGEEVHRADGWKAQVGFIRKIPTGAVPIYSVRVDRRFYHILKSSAGDVFVREADGHCPIKWKYGTTEGMIPGEKNVLSGGFLKATQRRIQDGGFYYPDINVKFNFQNDINEL